MEAIEIYRKMHLIRECEERIRKEYHKDEIKTPCHLAVGAESIAVGVCHIFPEAKFFGTYRNHHLYLACGGDLDAFWGELYGKETGCAKGKAGSMHLSDPGGSGLLLTSAVVGTTIPIAVGASLGSKMLLANTKTVVFFGDGATEEGVFHESLNFASLHKLPILFVCEDNGLTIHNKTETRQSFNLQVLVSSYGIPYKKADGQAIASVIETCQTLKPLLEKGPAFLHATYHRRYEHVGPNEDYRVGYRNPPLEPMEWDPMLYLRNSKCVSTVSYDERARIRAEVAAEINVSVNRAKQANFPGPEELMKDVFE